jgi:outer membrane protein OmpA-like peptidoglycan-associated protein
MILHKRIFLLLPLLFLLKGTLLAAPNDTIRFFFRIDGITLNEIQQKILDSIIPVIKNGDAAIEILGYADFLGNEAYNQELSTNRAKNIASQLVQKGITAKQITSVSGKGAVDPGLNKKTPDGIADHRLVQLIIHHPLPIRELNNITTKPKDEKKIIIDELKTGDKFVWENLNFYGGRHVLLPQSVPSLVKLLELLKEYPTLKIEIQGHICCEKNIEDGYDIDTYTYNLSLNRAKTVYHYLVKNGIEATRLSYIGFGRKFPIIENEITPEDATINRRVEIKIIEK